MGTRTFSDTPNPKSASLSHLGQRNPTAKPNGLEQSLQESSGSFFKMDSANCYKLYTSMEYVHTSMSRALQRKSQNFEVDLWLATSYYNCTRFSYIDLFLNSNYILKMKTLCSPFTVPPPPSHSSLVLKNQKNLKVYAEQKAKSQFLGSQLNSMLDLLAFFQWVRAKSTAACIYLSSYLLQVSLHPVSPAHSCFPSEGITLPTPMSMLSPQILLSLDNKMRMFSDFLILLYDPRLCSKLHFKSYCPFNTTCFIFP